MTLELAERGRKYVNVSAYKRSPKVAAHRRKKPKGLAENYNPYIYVPAHLNDGYNGIFVREDHFDGLSERDWNGLMDELLNHQPEISELAGKGQRKEKKAAKQATKAEKKAAREKRKSDKNERKNTKTNGKADAKKAKAEGKRLRGQAKVDKANNTGGESNSDKASNIFDTIVDKASGAYQKFKGGGDDPEQDGTDSPSASGGGGGGGSDSSTIMGIPKPVAIGLGVAVALGLGYLATRPHKQAA